MLVCVWLLLPCLLSVSLIPHSDALRTAPRRGSVSLLPHSDALRTAPRRGSVSLLPHSDALRTPPRFTQHPGMRLGSGLGARPQVSGLQSNLAGPSGVQKARAEMSEKLLLLDHLVRMENDVIEPKRKRSFPGGNTPLDRLSISVMDTKQASNKRKVVELPRRRISPPMDRIGVSRLPNSRG